MSALIKKVFWYRRRLASMSTAEVFHRLDEAVKRRLDQFTVAPITKDLGPIKPIPNMLKQFNQTIIFPEILAEWNVTLQQAYDGNFCLLNKTWPQHKPEHRWHLDPVTGKLWPRDSYSYQINYRHNPEMGDVKYVWELNRLQYLQPLAALAYIEKDPAIARFCLQEIENWINNNQPYLGINWTSGIEVALRAVSILIVMSFVGEYASSLLRAKIWGTLQAHGKWLERYPSKFSSANNHRTAEGLGLLAIGIVCPQLIDAENWKTQGWQILCESAATQIGYDGTGVEQAISYHEIVLEMLSLGKQLVTGDMKIPDSYLQQINRGYEFINWLTDKCGHKPHIGDNDEGFVLEKNIRHIFLGSNLTLQKPSGVKTFEQGGYTVGRHHVHGREVLFVFDHGNLGYLSIAAHGHADALSIWLHIDGQPVFVDAGTYLYHSGSNERDAFRGTAAHNTLCLEGKNSSTISGPFNWSHKANARITSSDLAPDNWSVESEHDGYIKNFGTRHRRKVEYNSAVGITIIDKITGSKNRNVQIGYLLHPDLSAAVDGQNIRIRKKDITLLQLRYEGPLKPEIKTDAFYSPSFGIKQTTTRIQFLGELEPDQASALRCLFSTND
jgi:uncharacterized heparinase superfamily protein